MLSNQYQKRHLAAKSITDMDKIQIENHEKICSKIQIENQEKICRIAIYEYFACKVSSKLNYEFLIERYRG